jgi:predicted alpha/beta-hydrolase family hydrolase
MSSAVSDSRDHAAKVWLGHGASGGPETMKPYVQRLRVLGIDASALRLPRGSTERAMSSLRDQVGAGLASAVIGGHSFGGRVASMVAADTAPAGLVLLSYPLHRPGHTDELRVAHWSRIACPVLLLSGDRDQFARIELLERSVRLLAHAELHIYPGLRHGLLAVADDVAGRIASFVEGLQAITSKRGSHA